eukprot:scaffold3917_cov377-Prasinococcus_capsulatus_cf.AAC.6
MAYLRAVFHCVPRPFLDVSQVDLSVPQRTPPNSSSKLAVVQPLKYYNTAIHSAAFVLPQFAHLAINGAD